MLPPNRTDILDGLVNLKKNGYENENFPSCNLYSVFADNLSKKMSWLAIKEAFEEYGRVVDVFIPRESSQDRGRSVNYAFIRYREKQRMERPLSRVIINALMARG
ncbi:Uncharacterized protein TCM_001337 [Theobroma cacao]|uniref:RRM domain-containing protein n=1 Tax=Theobroma cacao TaxID=3641 RepID=A0A061DJ77_THECC|nr:Uncharacterized protein TCM_001337 [Theobroma cacao]